MRPMLLFLIALLCVSEAQAQRPVAPRNLPGFEYYVSPLDGYPWWRKYYPDRENPTWVYFAKPVQSSMFVESPLTFAKPDQVVAYNGGLNLQAFSAGPSAPGFTTGGGEAIAQDCDDGQCPEPPPAPSEDAEQPNSIEQFFRRNNLDLQQVITVAAIGMTALVGLLTAAITLAVRRR